MRKVPFHLLAPFFLAVYPTLFLYSNNFFKVQFQDVLLALFISLLMALILLAVTSLVFRSLPRGLFLTSLALLLFFTYRPIFNLFENRRIFPFDNLRHATVLWGILLLAGVVYAVKKPRHLPVITQYLGITATFLIVMSLGTVAVNVVESSQPAAPPPAMPALEVNARAPEVIPDIYYIILDEYAGNSLLRDMGFDNSQFTDSLRDRGFYVAEDAHSNYYMTTLSLASSLNMVYLDHLHGHRRDDPSPFISMTHNNLVVQTMKQLGYTYVHFSTAFPVSRSNPLADIHYSGYERNKLMGLVEVNFEPLFLNDFNMSLVSITLLDPFINVYDSRTRNLANLETLARIPEMPEPTFTFAHLILPHAPFVFDRSDGPVNPNGRMVDGEIIDPETYALRARYLDQLVFTNRMISQLIDTILEKSETEPIILVQGDHGFRKLCSDCEAERRAWDDTYFGSVMLPILSAYYLPGDGASHLYPTISPVNTFRVIFDHYFDAELGLLDDRYFRPEDYATRSFHFVEITDAVRASQSAEG